MPTEQTPAQWLEDRFNAIWEREGDAWSSEDAEGAKYVIFRVPGQRDHAGKMISLKDDEYLSHNGARVMQTGELYDLANDLEVITL